MFLNHLSMEINALILHKNSKLYQCNVALCNFKFTMKQWIMLW